MKIKNIILFSAIAVLAAITLFGFKDLTGRENA